MPAQNYAPHGHQHMHAAPVAAVPVLVGSAQPVPQQAGVVKHKHGPLKPIIALTLLALAAILIGLLAYQAQGFFGTSLATNPYNRTDSSGLYDWEGDDADDDGPGWKGGSDNDDDDDGTGAAGAAGAAGSGVAAQNGNQANGNQNLNVSPNGPSGNNAYGGTSQNVGFNGAGTGMFFFGLLFAVLMAITALTMWVHLAYYMPHLHHSSVLGPLKVTAAVGFIAMGFACRHISLGAQNETSTRHYRVTHAIEAFIIINWFFVMLALILSLVSAKVHWACENLEEHRFTRRMTAGYTQLFLGIILIALLAAFFQFYTGRMTWYASAISMETEIFIVFAVLFAVLQAMSGWAMIQQSGHGAPGQLPETIHGLLKVVVAAGVIAFGFAIRSIYLHNHAGTTDASSHLKAIEAFVIISFIVTCYLTYTSDQGMLNWQNMNTSIGKRVSGFIFGILQLIFSIILFALLGALLQGLTENDLTQRQASTPRESTWCGLVYFFQCWSFSLVAP